MRGVKKPPRAFAKPCRSAPEEAAELAGIGPEDALPEAEGVEAKLEKLRRERENLGGVNLRAEEEADEIKQKIEAMTGERDELAAAINKLRHGIGQLNREGPNVCWPLSTR